jgi:5-methylcytosine-specific restriction endonuclease McrA
VPFPKDMPLEERRAKQHAYTAKYRAAHKEQIAAAEKARRAADPTWLARSAAAVARWRAAHPQGALEVSRRHDAKRGPAAKAALRRAWYLLHREDEIAKASTYAKLPEVATRRNARNRERYATDPVYHARCTLFAQQRRAWARKGDLTLDQWLQVCEDFLGMCAYCPSPATSMDHVVPRVNGGLHTKSNVVPACASCNSSKKDASLINWVARSAPRLQEVT